MLVSPERIELSADGLKVHCSTTELRAHQQYSLGGLRTEVGREVRFWTQGRAPKAHAGSRGDPSQVTHSSPLGVTACAERDAFGENARKQILEGSNGWPRCLALSQSVGAIRQALPHGLPTDRT